MMKKIKISAVSYLNSQPFIYGLKNSAINDQIELDLDIPSVCAEKLLEGKADIGLVPVAVLPELDEYHFVSDYCIGADGAVGSVLLLSDVPLNEIKTVLLDYQSRTSVLLAQVLAEKFWNIKPHWSNADVNFEKQIHGNTAGVVIGDRTFALKNKFKHVYDLSAEWKKYTQLPFVFACWVSNKEIDRSFVKQFNESLRFGLMNMEELIHENPYAGVENLDVKDYLENKISYAFDARKKFALDLFLKYESEILESDLLKIV